MELCIYAVRWIRTEKFCWKVTEIIPCETLYRAGGNYTNGMYSYSK